MGLPFATIINEDKLIPGSPSWSPPDGTDGRVKLVAPLIIKGRVFQGLELIGRAYADTRASEVSFNLVYLPTDNRREAIQLARIDWRPRTPHTNYHPKSPPALLGLDIDGTHHHSFELNWSDGTGKPLKWLPIAEPITPDYQTFTELVDGVGKLFRIGNAASGISSPWPPDLFNQ